MSQKIRSVFALLSVFLLLQTGKSFAVDFMLFVEKASGQEEMYTLSFEDEKDCRIQLQEIANTLSKNPPYKIAYSMEEVPSYIENEWDIFLLSLTPESSFDLEVEPAYLSSNSFSTLPIMQGWGSSITDPEPQTKEAEAFFNLRLTPKDKKNIELLISELADKSYLQLLANKASMNRKGDRARLVHPMRFIGFILSELYLHKCLRTIEKDSIKFKQFINGFESHMEEEAAKEDLLIYAPGFAQLLQVDPSSVEEILRNRNYADIIKKFL